jgi:hypothetical protein
MGLKAGTLLWNRQRIDLPAGGPTAIDTGLIQVNQSFAGMSPDEPGLTQRVQVIPMAPTNKWSTVTHSEPYIGPNGKVWVDFTNFNEGSISDLNVLFWDPHSMVGPGQAETYNGPQT